MQAKDGLKTHSESDLVYLLKPVVFTGCPEVEFVRIARIIGVRRVSPNGKPSLRRAQPLPPACRLHHYTPFVSTALN